MITFRGGKAVRGSHITFADGNINWVSDNAAGLSQHPISTVYSITFKSNGRATVRGMLIGGAIGVVGGALLGHAEGNDPPCSPDSWFCMRYTAYEKAKWSAIALGVLGATSGLLIGAIRGRGTTYMFHVDPSLRIPDEPEPTQLPENMIKHVGGTPPPE
jgi:hypothetical protein